MKKNTRILILIIIVMLIVLPFTYKDIIFQEGNPLPIFIGILKLNDSTTYVKINDNPVAFITKTNNQEELFNYIERENNVKFKEQFGSGYIFEGNEKIINMSSRQYTKFYKVWYYIEKIV